MIHFGNGWTQNGNSFEVVSKENFEEDFMLFEDNTCNMRWESKFYTSLCREWIIPLTLSISLRWHKNSQVVKTIPNWWYVVLYFEQKFCKYDLFSAVKYQFSNVLENDID